MKQQSYQFLGVKVDAIKKEAVIDEIGASLKAKKQLHIVTVNPELIMIARTHPEFKQVINQAGLVTPDGIGLVMIGAVTGRRLHERVTGVDLCYAIAKRAAVEGWRVYLQGAGTGVAKQAAARLTMQFPGLVICGTDDGNPTPEEAEEIVGRIKAAKADVLLVAFGSPTQELWLAEHGTRTDALVTMGVGGSFDFIAGVASRAPRLVQKIGLEWLWRLITQPWRWRRMLALPKFAVLALFEKHK